MSPLPRHLDADTRLCSCGHPRHMHEHLSKHYPAICSVKYPVPSNVDPADRDPREFACSCVDFEEDR